MALPDRVVADDLAAYWDFKERGPIGRLGNHLAAVTKSRARGTARFDFSGRGFGAARLAGKLRTPIDPAARFGKRFSG